MAAPVTLIMAARLAVRMPDGPRDWIPPPWRPDAREWLWSLGRWEDWQAGDQGRGTGLEKGFGAKCLKRKSRNLAFRLSDDRKCGLVASEPADEFRVWPVLLAIREPALDAEQLSSGSVSDQTNPACYWWYQEQHVAAEHPSWRNINRPFTRD